MIEGPRFLLDTNILSALARDPKGTIYEHIAQEGPQAVCTSVIVACEIRFGVEKKSSPALKQRMERILDAIEILALENDVQSHYGDIRWQLERTGQAIGPNDLLIAAQARSLGLVLVSGNVAEFSRVPGLRVENWLE
ncbi:MAG: type II toxin-antitoxin system VapC family toxin [Spirochaetota bacterium]